LNAKVWGDPAAAAERRHDISPALTDNADYQPYIEASSIAG
jgi:hypothetical protein